MRVLLHIEQLKKPPTPFPYFVSSSARIFSSLCYPNMYLCVCGMT